MTLLYFKANYFAKFISTDQSMLYPSKHSYSNNYTKLLFCPFANKIIGIEGCLFLSSLANLTEWFKEKVL